MAGEEGDIDIFPMGKGVKAEPAAGVPPERGVQVDNRESAARPHIDHLQAANENLLTLVLQLNAVSEMMCRGGMPLDKSCVLAGIAAGVRAELAFDRVCIWRYDALSRSFVGEAALGVPEELVRSLRFPLQAFMPFIGQILHDGRLLRQDAEVVEPLLKVVYDALGEPAKPAMLTPLLSRGEDRCWRVRRVAEGCLKAEAGPSRGTDIQLGSSHIEQNCLACTVFPLEGFLLADNAQSGRPVQDDLLPLGLFLRQADLMLENAALYEGLSKVTIQDALTGIYNRAYFEQVTRIETERCVRYGYPASIILLDVCGMRRINSASGRIAGDRLLTVFGELLRCRLRRFDFVARYSGDEFAILLPHTDSERALRVAERLHRVIAKHPFDLSSVNEPVRCSMGIAVVPENASDPDSLVGLAKFALQEAKEYGPGSTVRIGDPKPVLIV